MKSSMLFSVFLRVLCGKSVCAFLHDFVRSFSTTESTEVNRDQCALPSVFLRVFCGKSIRALLAKVAWILKWFATRMASQPFPEPRPLFFPF